MTKQEREGWILSAIKCRELLQFKRYTSLPLSFSSHEPSFHNRNLWMRKSQHQKPRFPEGNSGKIPFEGQSKSEVHLGV